MSQLGDTVGKAHQRKFVQVNISRILGADSAPTGAGSPKGFKPYTLSGHQKADTHLQEEISRLKKELAAAQSELSSVKAELKSKVGEARSAGLREGESQGREAATLELKNAYETSIDSLQTSINIALQKLAAEKTALFQSYEGEVSQLFLASLRKFLNIHVVENQEAVIAVLEGAVKSLGEVADFVVKVHPEDFKTVTDKQNIWLPLRARSENIRIDSDERVERGGAILESKQASVEVSFEKILQNLEQEFLKIQKKHLEQPEFPGNVSGEVRSEDS